MVLFSFATGIQIHRCRIITTVINLADRNHDILNNILIIFGNYFVPKDKNYKSHISYTHTDSAAGKKLPMSPTDPYPSKSIF